MYVIFKKIRFSLFFIKLKWPNIKTIKNIIFVRLYFNSQKFAISQIFINFVLTIEIFEFHTSKNPKLFSLL